MKRRFPAAIAAGALLCTALSGCWDYRSLDELTIVAGVAIEYSENDPDLYAVSFEIIDSQSSAEKGVVQSVMLESEGKTIFEAVHNADKSLHNEIYFGNTQLVIVSHQLAAKEGLGNIMDSFLRDFSTRDNVNFIISREKTAKEIIQPDKDSKSVVSYNISNSIGRDKRTTNSTRTLELYRIYDYLTLGADNLALPAFRLEETEDGAKQPTADGMAVFKNDRMVSYLMDDKLPSFLLTVEKLQGGTYTFFLEPEEDDEDRSPMGITLEIMKSQYKKSHEMNGDKLKLKVRVDVLCSAIDISRRMPKITDPVVRQLEQRASQSLEQDISAVIRGMQQGSGSDIFGFGYMLYNTDPKLWAELSDDWENAFRKAEIEVECVFRINDTGLIRSYEGVKK